MSLKIIHIHIICILCQPQILSHQLKACGLKTLSHPIFCLECVKFRESRGSRTFVLSCLCGSKTFSRRYFEGPKFTLVVISWVQNFFSLVFCVFKIKVFCVSKIFSGCYFVYPKFSRAYISCVQDFSGWYFACPQFALVGISWV